MTSSINALSSSSSSTNSQNSTSLIKKLEQNPENFPLYMAQLTNYNINGLFSLSSASDDQSSSSGSDSLFGLTGNTSSSDSLFGSLGLSGSSVSSSDPLSSLFTNQGLLSGTDFFNPYSSMDSYKVAETLEGFQDYSNLKETKSWLGQVVTYVDPDDNKVYNGEVTKVIVENVNKPVFIINGKEIEVENITSMQAQTNTLS